MRTRFITAATIAAAIAAGAGVATHSTAEATALALTPAQNTAAQQVAAKLMTAPGQADAVVGKGSDIFAALDPGENPLGDAMNTVAGHDVLVVRVAQHIVDPTRTMHLVPGYTPPKPVAVLVYRDLTTGQDLGRQVLFNADQVARVDLAKVTARTAQSPVIAVQVPSAG
jgi:hypothetical protein